MRRRSESMNDEKKSAALGRALLSGPYLIWMIGFTIIPLALIFWFGIPKSFCKGIQRWKAGAAVMALAEPVVLSALLLVCTAYLVDGRIIVH